MVKPRTPKVTVKWLHPRDIAADMGVSGVTARSIIRRIPGAERMYTYENRKGERWRVLRDDYEKWRAGQRAAG